MASRLQCLGDMMNAATVPPSLIVRVVPRDRHW
jgi:hypothetical protein